MKCIDIQIRIASSDDLHEVQSCARAAYEKYIERIGKEPAPMVADFQLQIQRGQMYIATAKSLFAGFIVFYPRDDHLHLENVAVMPQLSGLGVGKKLIAYAELAARDNNLIAVELYTNEKMTENLSLYPKLGYVETERKQQAGFNRVFFRKFV